MHAVDRGLGGTRGFLSYVIWISTHLEVNANSRAIRIVIASERRPKMSWRSEKSTWARLQRGDCRGRRPRQARSLSQSPSCGTEKPGCAFSIYSSESIKSQGHLSEPESRPRDSRPASRPPRGGAPVRVGYWGVAEKRKRVRFRGCSRVRVVEDAWSGRSSFCVRGVHV